MAKQPSSNRANRGHSTAQPQDRAAKIRAAQKATTTTGGANKITIAGIVAILAIIAVVGGVIWSQKSSETDAGSGNPNPPAGATVADGYRAFADVTLKAGAPTLTIFEDFQCPVCGQFEAAAGAAVEELAKAGDVKLQYHIMNFLDGKFNVKQSTPIANGAFCAADQGKWQEFHDAAYKSQAEEGKSVTKDQLTGYATAAGLSGTALEKWTACSDAGKYNAYIANSNDAAGKAGVGGTPTVRLNGKDIPLATAADPTALKKAVADATGK
ncbi:MAG: DsbA family protein [Actinobacteria bacterium]|uniref:Thioredoxin domain-containing protein n=1 Tax=Nostocoides veronense TaxID=330836 RepID=A0ABP4XQ62_9MICO|nr:DsbA family protein [Actinomycetota bacterium]